MLCGSISNDSMQIESPRIIIDRAIWDIMADLPSPLPPAQIVSSPFLSRNLGMIGQGSPADAA